MWKVVLSKKALKQVKKLDPSQGRIILAWLKKHLDGCSNPRALGKPLKGTLSDEWRYRVGDYRILCDIQDDRLVILALNIEHRGRVYKKR